MDGYELNNRIVKLLSCFIPNKNKRENFRKNHTIEIKKFQHNIKPKFVLPDSPEVSVIIPVFNQFYMTYECLKSIAYYKPEVSFEIIIADDLSTDKTRKIEKLIKGIKVARTTGNCGFGGNVQNAVKYAKGKYIFLMNNDMLVTQNWLDSLYETISKDNNIGVVGSISLNEDNSVQEYGSTIDSEGYSHYRTPQSAENLTMIDTDYCSGCSIMFLKEDWDKLGGFDEQFSPAYYEDTDLCFSIHYKLGKRIVCQPKSQIYHFRGKTYSQSAQIHSEKNRLLFVKKWEKYLTNSAHE